MKKLVFTLLSVAMLNVTASAKNDTDAIKSNSKPESKTDAVCRVSCSYSVVENGVTHTYSTSAGNMFTSCDTAAAKCDEKLNRIMTDEE